MRAGLRQLRRRGGCETGLTGNFDHCLACGRSCALRGTSRECGASGCVTLGCLSGFTDCSAAVEGCEAFLATDGMNCGSCGVTCGFGSSCSAGHCCEGGRAWCGSACVRTDDDPNNCGGCGNVCPAATPRCFDYDCVT